MTISATEAITSRRSVRAYTSEPVDEAVLRTILRHASRAASGTNIQPWHVTVLQERSLCEFIAVIQAEFDQGNTSGNEKYYPTEFVEPYLGRRRKIGWDMYGLVGIEKGDKEKMTAQTRKNFEFFGAPVGLIFSMHETMNTGSWLDLGLFMGNIMTLAREHGLDTCPQAAWREFEPQIHSHLELPEDHRFIVAMALGYEDTSHVINELRTVRASLDEFVDFRF